jgi:gluconate kinase
MKTGKMNWDSMFEGHALDDARCEGWDQAIEKIKQNTTQTEQGKQSWK